MMETSAETSNTSSLGYDSITGKDKSTQHLRDSSLDSGSSVTTSKDKDTIPLADTRNE